MGIYRCTTKPFSTDSKAISDVLQAQGLDVEVMLNHQSGECQVRWGEESQTAKHVKLNKNQYDKLSRIMEDVAKLSTSQRAQPFGTSKEEKVIKEGEN